MKYKEYQEKDLETLKNIVKEDLQDNSYIMKITEEKGSLFKGSSYKAKVYLITDIAEEIKSFLNETLTNMGIEATYETKIRDEQITIKMYSNQNNILIGKEGKTLEALKTLIRQHIYREINVYPYILLDVENYQDKKVRHLEHLAKDIARDVLKTKQPVIMDNMNSYERRIVHETLKKYDKLTTFSEGVEPNRHIVVKIKED